MRGAALAILVLGGIFPTATLLSSDKLEQPQLAGLAVVTALVIVSSGSLFARSFRSSDASAVTTSRDGIRVADGREVSWSEIVTGRPAKIGDALQLIGRDGERLATIDYRVEGIDVVLDMLGRELRPRAPEPRVFGSPRRRLTWVLINAAIVATTFTLLQDMSAPMLLLMGAIGLWIFWSEGKERLQQIEIDDDAVTLKTLLGRTTIRREEVQAVKLTLRTIRNVRSLDVAVLFRNGNVQFVTPLYAQALDVYRALRAWHSR